MSHLETLPDSWWNMPLVEFIIPIYSFLASVPFIETDSYANFIAPNYLIILLTTPPTKWNCTQKVTNLVALKSR